MADVLRDMPEEVGENFKCEKVWLAGLALYIMHIITLFGCNLIW